MDVVGTVVHVTPLRSTTTRGGRASSVFNVFMTDESGELLDVMVVGARPSLRAQFPQGRSMGLLDLRFTNYHERYGVTRCIFGDKSGVITQSQRPHVAAGLAALSRWLATPGGRTRVMVRGVRAVLLVSAQVNEGGVLTALVLLLMFHAQACRNVADGLTRGQVPDKPLKALHAAVHAPVASHGGARGPANRAAVAAFEATVVGAGRVLSPMSPRIFATSRNGPLPPWVARYCLGDRLGGRKLRGACQLCWDKLGLRSQGLPTGVGSLSGPRATQCVSLDVTCIDTRTRKPWQVHLPPDVLWGVLVQALAVVSRCWRCCSWSIRVVDVLTSCTR